MNLSRRIEKLEIQRAADDEIMAEKIHLYFERAVPAIATKLGIHPDDVTTDIMAENGDPLVQLIMRVKARLYSSSCAFDLA